MEQLLKNRICKKIQGSAVPNKRVLTAIYLSDATHIINVGGIKIFSLKRSLLLIWIIILWNKANIETLSCSNLRWAKAPKCTTKFFQESWYILCQDANQIWAPEQKRLEDIFYSQKSRKPFHPLIYDHASGKNCLLKQSNLHDY